MVADVERGALMLADADVDLIVFHCTAASMFAPGFRRQHYRPDRDRNWQARDIDVEGLCRGVRDRGLQKITLTTPYIQVTNDREVAFLASHGVEVLWKPASVSLATVAPCWRWSLTNGVSASPRRTSRAPKPRSSAAPRSARWRRSPHRGGDRQAGDYIKPGDGLARATQARHRRPGRLRPANGSGVGGSSRHH